MDGGRLLLLLPRASPWACPRCWRRYKEFHQELQKKSSHKLLDDAIHALHSASHLSPWVVTNGAKDGILANHRANMSTYIGEAEHVIATLQTLLATN